MAWNVIPLDNTPDQEFNVTVDVDGISIPLFLHLRFNTEGQFWHMDIADGRDHKMLVSGIPMLTGEYPAADLLQQFQHIGIGSAVIVENTDQTEDENPGMFDLGTDFLLLWGDNSGE